MKTILAAFTGIGMMAILATSAEATTCSQRAANCVKNGGDRADCYSRVPACKRSCTYVGPRGSWPASGDCGKK